MLRAAFSNDNQHGFPIMFQYRGDYQNSISNSVHLVCPWKIAPKAPL
jgi:hypothetical protein